MDARDFIQRKYGVNSWYVYPPSKQLVQEWLDEYHKAKLKETKTLTTHEDQPISDFAKQVKEFVVKEWGSHNLDAFVEVLKMDL